MALFETLTPLVIALLLLQVSRRIGTFLSVRFLALCREQAG
jgi:hypothetical protein